MKKIYLLGLLVMACSAFVSCSDDEDTTPSYADSNRFAPADDDNSAEATFRRAYFDNTGVYVMFNDTLRKTQTGVDAQGNPVYQNDVLDIAYDMFSTSYTDYNSYTFEYIKDWEARERMAELVKDKVLKKLGTLAPFSILLVDKINSWESSNGELTLDSNPLYYLGSQCYVISAEEGEVLENPSMLDGILGNIVYSKVKNQDDSFFKDFFALVTDYSKLTDWRYDKSDLGYENKYNDDLARSLGFLRDGSKYSFRSQDGDIQDYVKAVFQYSQSDFEEAFADYPICIARFNKMKELIRSLGVVLD